MSRLVAFLMRDARAAASYRLGFVLGALAGLLTLALFFFVARTMGEVPLLRQRYGADYFTFALVGIALATLLRGLQTGFARRVRDAQVDGTLETFLSAPLPTVQVVLLMSAYPTLTAIARFFGLLLAGSWLFGATLHVDPAALCASLALSVLCFAALGLASSAMVLVLKRADPLTWALDLASWLLSGVVYPLEVLPGPLRALSPWLPATHALRALRGALLGTFDAAQLWPLAGFALGLWPLAVLALLCARRHVERDGTLPQS